MDEMVNGVGWDLLNNGSMIRAAYEVYDGAAAFNGFAFAILYFLFHVMLFAKTRKPIPGIVMSFLFLVMYQTNQFFDFLVIHMAIFWVAIAILVLELGVLIVSWILKH